MKDADFILRKAYTTALAGNVLSNGKVVPVYDRVPNDVKPPWIKFGQQATIDDSDKDQFTTEHQPTETGIK